MHRFHMTLGVAASFGIAAVMLFGALAPFAVGATLGLGAYETPEATARLDTIVLAVPAGATDAEGDVWVRQSGDRALEGVRFSATLPGKSVTVTASGAQDGKVGVPASDGAVRLSLKVTGPAGGATDGGRLVAEGADGAAQTVAQFRVERDEDAVLAIEGATTDGLVRTVSVDGFSAGFDITSSKREPLRDVRIQVDPLSDPDAVEIEPLATLDGVQLNPNAGYDFGALGTRRLVIAADLVVSGDHSGKITLLYGGQRTSVALKVTRSRVKPSVEVVAPGTVQQETTSQAGFPLELRPLEGRTGRVGAPSLRVERKDGTANFVQTGQRVLLDGGDDGVTIAGDDPKTVQVSLPDLDGPGEYTARLTFGGGEQKLEATATLFRRWPFWFAILILLPTLFISGTIRKAWTETAIRKRSQHSIAQIRVELDRIVALTPLHADDARPVAIMLGRLGRAYEQLEADAGADVASERKFVTDRLESLARWLALRRAAREASAGQAVEEQLVIAARWLCGDADDKAASLTAMDAAQKAIDRGPGVREELDALNAAVESWIKELADAPAALGDLRATLHRAFAKLKEGDVTGADAERLAAWNAWTTAAAAALEQRLQGSTPPGVATSAWGALKTGLAGDISAARAGGDPAAALAHYRAAARSYLKVVAEGLLMWLGGSETEPEKRAEANAAAAATLAALDADLGGAWSKYAEAAAIVGDLGKKQGETRAPDGRGAPEVMWGEPARAADTSVAVVVPGVIIRAPDKIAKELKSIQQKVSLGAGLIAILTALLLIWAPDKDWGGVTDLIALVLWGLGLHQIGNVAAFTGVPALTEKLAGVKRQPPEPE